MKLCWYCAIFFEKHNTLTTINREIHESLSVSLHFNSLHYSTRLEAVSLGNGNSTTFSFRETYFNFVKERLALETSYFDCTLKLVQNGFFTVAITWLLSRIYYKCSMTSTYASFILSIWNFLRWPNNYGFLSELETRLVNCWWITVVSGSLGNIVETISSSFLAGGDDESDGWILFKSKPRTSMHAHSHGNALKIAI